MLHNKKNTLIARNILMMWLILFALSPCTVKEFLFKASASAYSQTLNKSRTTVAANSCQYSQNIHQQTVVVKQSKIKRLPEPVDPEEPYVFPVRVINAQSHYSEAFSGNSPPKYILYKRLKLDLA